ncbi:hypothetical protein Nm8I071_21810 [Nonomuraea sp. TT08I-71]|nr:hypothetical protein Nm8I071_21810 [Nonomuraea sp. TT08I-71]
MTEILETRTCASCQPPPTIKARAAAWRYAAAPAAALSWQEFIAVSGATWPNTGAYLDAHLHRHEQCGHLSRCGFPDQNEPCQAVE